jgi:hypothetical protein
MGGYPKQRMRGRDISLVDYADEGPDEAGYAAIGSNGLTIRRSKREAYNNPGPRAFQPIPFGLIRAVACAPGDLRPVTLGY